MWPCKACLFMFKAYCTGQYASGYKDFDIFIENVASRPPLDASLNAKKP